MSLIGKGTSSLRKKDVMEQRSIALGFKKIRFAHKATLGDTGINLTSLVQPTEMATYGFLNPSVAELSRAKINLFRNNLKLVSSTKGLLIDQLSYTVGSATQIAFIDFTADDGEIFTGWLDEAPTTSLSVVDGSPIVASGILLAGNTDFNIGMPIPINDNPSMQMGAVVVFADRGLQYRKVGNVTGGDGDYIEVPVAGGLGSLIRFNASGSDRFITVMSNGVVAERPDGSMTAMIERAQGQIDAMIPTLAALAGVPETTFQTAPNDVNLKQFGDAVVANAALDVVQDTRLTALELPPVNLSCSSNNVLLSTTGSGASALYTGNSIVLTPGRYLLYGLATIGPSGSPQIRSISAQWHTVNGTNATALSGLVSALVPSVGINPGFRFQGVSGSLDVGFTITLLPFEYRVSATQTVFLNSAVDFSVAGTAAQAVYGFAQKISTVP